MPKLSLAGREFDCKESIPGWQMVKIGAAASSEIGLWGVYLDFFKAVLMPSEVDGFLAHMEKADDIQMADIEAAFSDLMGEYAKRPTVKSTSSPDGAAPTPATSKVVDLSRGKNRDSSNPGRSAAS